MYNTTVILQVITRGTSLTSSTLWRVTIVDGYAFKLAIMADMLQIVVCRYLRI